MKQQSHGLSPRWCVSVWRDSSEEGLAFVRSPLKGESETASHTAQKCKSHYSELKGCENVRGAHMRQARGFSMGELALHRQPVLQGVTQLVHQPLLGHAGEVLGAAAPHLILFIRLFHMDNAQ